MADASPDPRFSEKELLLFALVTIAVLMGVTAFVLVLTG
jgi:hypothetical protein